MEEIYAQIEAEEQRRHVMIEKDVRYKGREHDR